MESLAAGGHSPLSWRQQWGAACTSPGAPLRAVGTAQLLSGLCSPSSALCILSQVHARLAVWFGPGQNLILEGDVRIHHLACRGALLPRPDVPCLLEITLSNLLPWFHCFVTYNMLCLFCLMCSGEILNNFW